MSKPIRMLIADNNVEFSKAMKRHLNAQEDIRVVDTVRDGQGAVNACHLSLPDLVLMDLHLPVLDSIRAIQSILAQNDRIKILTISTCPNDRYAIEAIKAGACGYVEKNCKTCSEKIIHAIRQVALGEVVLNSVLASHILREFS